MSMPKVSVIVPVYKVEEYINDCIDSILSQTFSNFELILIDDGSPDKCGLICDNYASKDKRITVIHQENGGLSFARNSGLDIAKGEYVTFVDSDDSVNVHYLEILYENIHLFNADIAACKTSLYKEEKEFDCNGKGADNNAKCMVSREAILLMYSNRLNQLTASACGKLFKKGLFDKQRFPVGKLYEDQYIIPIVFYNADTVVWIPKPLYGYRERDGSITHEKFSIKRFDFAKALEHCFTYFKSISETEIASVIELRKIELVAYYSLLARKAKIFKNLPSEYRMGRCKAVYLLKKNLSYDIYSYRVAKVYPRFISIEAHIRRALQIIGFIR